jgi:ribosomal protein S18 acetylase RimI-like enzyme
MYRTNMGGIQLIRAYRESDRQQVVEMIASLRVFLATLKSLKNDLDHEAASAELQSYLDKGFPIFVADEQGSVVGYLVCKIDDGIVWAESLFVRLEFRRRGIASALYSEAEQLVQRLGSDTVFNWVHPNNNVSISFLKARGYNVLNLIELRRPWKHEKLSTTIHVEDHAFDY